MTNDATPDRATAPHPKIDEAASRTVIELLRDARFAMVTTVAAGGDLLARPMAIQEVSDDGGLWFFIGANSGQAAAIQADARVNVSVAERDSWVSVSGRGQISRDRTLIERLWNPSVEAWFTGGKDDPQLALLHVDGASAEYWDSPAGGRVASLVSFVKAKVTGEPLRGDNEATELP